MLGQKTPVFEDPVAKKLAEEAEKKLCERIAAKATVVYNYEGMIDRDRPLYLITWSPDPKQMSDCDFNLQHQLNVKLVADYLKCCYSGLFCLEATQKGNPHYHGWYQVNDETELARIAIMKVLQRFGDVKLDYDVKHYKINCYYEKGNALWYYKKDMIQSMLNIDLNPICITTEITLNLDNMELIAFFDKHLTKHVTQKYTEIQSQRDFYRNFYKDTMEFFDS